MKTSLSHRWRLTSNLVMSSPFDLVSQAHAWDLLRTPPVLVKNHQRVLQQSHVEEERRDRNSSNGD